MPMPFTDSFNRGLEGVPDAEVLAFPPIRIGFL
jgi:hypothetical protein